MIMLTRLSGTAFVLNADLVERLDATPDTVVTLVDGKKYVVSESLDEVVSRVRSWRGGIIAASAVMGGDHQVPVTRGHLAPVALHPTMDGDA